MAGHPLPRWAGIALLLVIATVFGSNHVAARVAFEHGANVTAAVAVRSGGTALAVLALLLWQRVPLRLARATRWHAVAIGVLIALQSYCLYSAVALIPVALALLAFNTFPMLFTLLAWAMGGARPAARALAAMPVALAGLSLALDVWGSGGDMAGRWGEIGAGVAWALAAAVTFACVLYLNGRWLAGVDGRLRSCVTMAVVAVVLLAAGSLGTGFAFPADAVGWLGLALLTLFYGSAITVLFTVLPRLGAATDVAALNIEPIAVLAIAWAVLGQAVAPLQILGAFVVVGAIVVLGSGKR